MTWGLMDWDKDRTSRALWEVRWEVTGFWGERTTFQGHLWFFFVCLFFFSGAVLAAYGSFQAESWISAIAVGHSHSNSGSEPCLPPTPQLTANAGSLIHWVRPGIEPTSLWILVGWVSTEPRQELPGICVSKRLCGLCFPFGLGEK